MPGSPERPSGAQWSSVSPSYTTTIPGVLNEAPSGVPVVTCRLRDECLNSNCFMNVGHAREEKELATGLQRAQASQFP